MRDAITYGQDCTLDVHVFGLEVLLQEPIQIVHFLSTVQVPLHAKLR